MCIRDSLRPEPLFAITVPHKVFTYLAAAKPLIIGGEGDVASLVTEANAGLVCCPGDPEALARAILTLHSMTCEELNEMGSNGRRIACQSFGCALMVKQLSQMLGDAVTAQ